MNINFCYYCVENGRWNGDNDCDAQLSTPSAGPSALDSSQRAADTGRDDRQRAAGTRGQTAKVTEYIHDCVTECSWEGKWKTRPCHVWNTVILSQN